MDSDTKATFRALIEAVNTLVVSLWDVYDIRQLNGPIAGKAALAANPSEQVEVLLASARILLDAPGGVDE